MSPKPRPHRPMSRLVVPVVLLLSIGHMWGAGAEEAGQTDDGHQGQYQNKANDQTAAGVLGFAGCRYVFSNHDRQV